jgi:uncharacterized protein with ParB-like and HNH nuclease domain/predicted transport protein
MKALETNYLKLMQGPKQFIIPIYQRTYSWTIKQCQQLWDDIERAAVNDFVAGHFIGSIVYIEKGIYSANISAPPKLLVIDGQQRLTTLSLLLAAFSRIIDEGNGKCRISRSKINNYYLFNSEESGELRYKLILNKRDKWTLINLLEGKELLEPFSKRVVDNYNFFLERITKCGLDLDTIYRGIEKLIVVDIALDRNYDNPQLIFESLNSTGLELSQTDLIRNFVLMGLDANGQEEIYRDYWYPMEKVLIQDGDTTLFDRFMRDYLTVKMGNIPKIKEVYDCFKRFYSLNAKKTTEEIMADIYRYSKHFIKLVFLKETEPEINDVLKDIRALKTDVSFPFLLEVYDDYENQRLSRQDFITIFRLVESYVFRRSICGIPTNSLDKTFSTLMKEIDKEKYLESFEIALLRKGSYRRFPRNDEFIREFMAKDVYNFHSRNYLLGKLENIGRKEKVMVGNYTIEHIMPQNNNLSLEWRKELGDDWKDVQANYLHTIGNLTLTGYNSELSDRPFNEKRDINGGFADSPLHLNKSLATLDTWNEEEIKKRAEELSKAAVEVWPIPEYKDIEDYKITAKEMLINVFPAEKDLIAAKEIAQEIARIVDLDQAQHILSVTYRDGNMISVNLGNWLIIRFKRVGDSYEISLCLDWSYSERFENYYFSKIEDFSDRWSSGRWVRLVTFPWNHTTELAAHIKDSWESAILTAYQVFKSWTASSYKKYSQEELAAHLFQEDYKNKHINSMSEETLSLFNLLRRRILNLDASVHEEYKKVYIAYKTDTNFVDIIPLKKELILTLNMPFDKIYDPHNLCKDISSAGHWGNGDVEFRVSTPTQLDMAMYLINQSFESHRDDDAEI